MPFSASIILVRVFEGGIDESMLGCHIKVTA